MKKVLLGWVAIAGMLFASSCSKETEMPAASGNEVTISLNVGVERVLSTRAISDGTGANKLVYQILDEAGAPVGDVVTKESVSFPVQETVTLIKGKTYKMVAWAQNGSCAAYDLEAFPTVSVDYTGAVNNDETRDAFFKTVEFEVYDGMESVSVTLKRPFAQINVGTLQETAIVKSSMVVKGGYSEIDLTDGSVAGGLEEITFAAAEVPSEELKVKAADEETAYKWLSMSYVLINEKENLEVTFSFENEAGEPINELNVPAVPVERNHRTNLLGTFTVDVDFDIDTDGGYDGDNDEDVDFTKPGEGGEDPEEPTFTVSEVKAEYAEGSVTFSAKYVGEKESIESAYFVYGPATRAAESGKVEATVGEGVLTAETTLAPGSYTVTVEINDKIVESTTADEDTATVVVPEEEPEQPNDVAIVTTLSDLKAGTYYLAGYSESYSGTTFAPYSYHIWTGKVSSGDLVTSGYKYDEASNTFTLNLNDSNKGVAAKIEIEAAGTANAYYIKYDGQYLYSSKASTNRSMGQTSTPTEWVFSEHEKGGLSITSNDVILGTAGAASNLLRSYKSPAASLVYGIALISESVTIDNETTTDPDPDPDFEYTHTGMSAEDAFTVAEAIAKCKEIGTTASSEWYYVKGKIATIKYTFSANYGTAQFTMVDEGSDAVFTAYSVKYFNNQSWVEGNMQVAEGDEVIVYGAILNYQGNTPETQTGSCHVYSINGKTSDDGGNTGGGTDPSDPVDPNPGEESVVYTLDTSSKKGSNSDYSKSGDIAINDVTWTLEGNSTTDPWRLGGKSTNTTNADRALYSKTAIAENISKIEVEHGTISGITVNSFKVIVAKDADFNQVVSTLDSSCTANTTATILRPADADWSNCYYKFVYNLTATSTSNGYVSFKKATFTGK